jgi:copper transporter 1
MLWNWYTIDACFISSSWHITTQGGFAASCIGVILMVVLLEGLRRMGKEYDEWILRGFHARLALIASDPDPASCRGNNGEQQSRRPMSVTFRATPLQQLGRAVLHAATFGVAYIIMLLAMYFNGYIIICIFIGAGLGKFFCDWMAKTIVLGQEGGVGQDAAGIDEPTVCCG